MGILQVMSLRCVNFGAYIHYRQDVEIGSSLFNLLLIPSEWSFLSWSWIKGGGFHGLRVSLGNVIRSQVKKLGACEWHVVS
jgi:hypothetical protein